MKSMRVRNSGELYNDISGRSVDSNATIHGDPNKQ